MKEASIIKVAGGQGLDKYNYTMAVVAEVSISVDQALQKSDDTQQKVSTHLAVLDSELDAMYMALNCGESADVVKQECVAAIARLVQIYRKVGEQHGEASAESEA